MQKEDKNCMRNNPVRRGGARWGRTGRGRGCNRPPGALGLGWPFRAVPGETSSTHQPSLCCALGRLNFGVRLGWPLQGGHCRHFPKKQTVLNTERLDREPSSDDSPLLRSSVRSEDPSLCGFLSLDSAHSLISPSERARCPPQGNNRPALQGAERGRCI